MYRAIEISSIGKKMKTKAMDKAYLIDYITSMYEAMSIILPTI